MRYVTIAELSDTIRHNIWQVPHDVDVVVGVPRSGLMAASLIALYLNKRLSDIDSILKGRIIEMGARGEFVEKKKIQHILVVDDSVYSGCAIRKAKERLQHLSDQYRITFLAPIVTSIGAKEVDIYFTIIDDNRIFEWNLFHHGCLEEACLDMDGVLCVDPEIDDDGEQYRHFLQNAVPLFIPTVKVGAIVTCRLSKYRKLTEQWLFENGISYGQLIMLDLPSREERIKWNKRGEWKGEVYRQSSCTLFIESDEKQAQTIANISHKDVISIASNRLLHCPKTRWQRLKHTTKGIMRRFCPRLLNCVLTYRSKCLQNSAEPNTTSEKLKG